MNIAINIESEYTLKQEMLHSFIHGLGVVFGLLWLPDLIFAAIHNRDNYNLAATGIYSGSFLMTFISSTLFHSTADPKRKYFFKLMDYSSIYFLIAASYTPLILHFRNDLRGIVLLVAIWILCLTGVALKLLLKDKLQLYSVCSYVLIGVAFLLEYKTFFNAMPTDVFTFVIAGVCIYITGLVFYVWRKWKYHHAAWHLFTLSGAICHFKAIMITVST